MLTKYMTTAKKILGPEYMAYPERGMLYGHAVSRTLTKLSALMLYAFGHQYEQLSKSILVTERVAKRYSLLSRIFFTLSLICKTPTMFDTIKKAADTTGHPEGQLIVGLAFSLGYPSTDHATAKAYFSRAAKFSSITSLLIKGDLATSPLYGIVTADSTLTAVKHFTAAAEKGSAFAQFRLGCYYENGTGVKKDIYKAASYYHDAAKQGLYESIYAYVNLILSHPTASFRPRPDILECLRHSAEKDNYLLSQAYLALLYLTGKAGCKKDHKAALRLYTIAAQKGLITAQSLLGCWYRDGTHCIKNLITAEKWFRMAAFQNDANAQFNLAVFYDTKKPALAFEWYQKAAEQGLKEAQFNLALCYQKGIGVEADDEKTLEWMTKAAEQDDVDAQVTLSAWYRDGRYVVRDDRRAVEWLIKAAEQGDKVAQYSLGRRFTMGEGVPFNIVEARKWLRASAEQGYSRATFMLDIYTKSDIAREPSSTPSASSLYEYKP